MSHIVQELSTISKAVTRINMPENKITSSVKCKRCNMARHKAVD